ncbi:LytTR family DNA-binding domain-containing protein [Clostridioides mangenotii]|uniref:LytR/AlgR family response regulator transcription factor n=1 Tax=Metaclostridioides mangenotii TaxID=1540 RepID=UPI001C1188A1|nr:LytTR family DNA-binding domain-containing protein [Clostridioides mangenotii]MBU5308301.1 LytTR family DNA-binding domain-containing protein [Clostridioides mangenotii]
MLEVFLCDDTESIIEKYKNILLNISKEKDIKINITTFSSAEHLLFDLEGKDCYADIIFLDILMGKMNGIELAKILRSRGCKSEIIFLTTSVEYVFESFDALPFNYIIKDKVTPKKFEEVFLKAASTVDRKKTDMFVCESGSVVKKIPLNDILFFEVRNRITTVYYGESSFNFYSSMDKIEVSLAKKHFIRTHRSYLVNLRNVDKIEKNNIIITNGISVPLSLSNSKNVKSTFSKYLTESI